MFSLPDIDTDHLQAYSTIRLHNKNSFDLLLVTQAYVEQFLFVTADSKILESSYKVQDATK